MAMRRAGTGMAGIMAFLCALASWAPAALAQQDFSVLSSDAAADHHSYVWIDPGSDAKYVPFQDYDDGFTKVSLDFDFPFYGQKYKEVGISTNGYLAFGAHSAWTAGSSSEPINASLPTTKVPNSIAAPFWDDLILGPESKVVFRKGGSAPNRYAVVTWHKIHRFYTYAQPLGNPHRFTFQAVLYEQGLVRFQYHTMSNNGGKPDYASGMSATVGIENAAGDKAVQFLFGTLNPKYQDGNGGFGGITPSGRKLKSGMSLLFGKRVTLPVPQTLTQSDHANWTAAQPGFMDGDDIMWLRAQLKHSDPSVTLAIQAEVAPDGKPFTGLNVVQGNPVPSSGGVSEVSTGILPNGDYQWRARTTDTFGRVSSWVEFAGADVDFKIGKGLIDETRENRNGDENGCSHGLLGTAEGHALWLAAVVAGLLAACFRRF